MELRKYIVFGDFVQPICLPSLNKIKAASSKKQGCKFSGWTGGKSGEHYLVGHAAEVNREINCKDKVGNILEANQNCLSVRNLTPPKFSLEKKSRQLRKSDDENPHENGMPLVCPYSASIDSIKYKKYIGITWDYDIDQYELVGLYSKSNQFTYSETREGESSIQGVNEHASSLQFLRISPYIPWIKVRLTL